MSVAKNLAAALGGEWKYDGRASWWCDDGKRHVSRCATAFDGDEESDAPPQYWLYGEGAPSRAEQFMSDAPDPAERECVRAVLAAFGFTYDQDATSHNANAIDAVNAIRLHVRSTKRKAPRS